ncbi:MAG: phenylphosphate carboxylase subunit delta, partial [Deltaproteobacteria bacterium RBG_13_51_10]
MRARSWNDRAKKIHLLLLDVDGVLTDGRIVYDGREREFKSFDIKDGQGIKLFQQAGLKVGILSGRKSSAVRLRAKELGIEILYQKALDKAKTLEVILQKNKIRAEQICFMGDDLVDLPVLLRVGLAVAVADGVEEVKANAHYVTHHPGGRGAVREICELILKAQGKWESVTQKYT